MAKRKKPGRPRVKKKAGRPKGSKKQFRTPPRTESRTQAKRQKAQKSLKSKLKANLAQLLPKKGHNYSRRKDGIRVILLLLVTAFLEHAEGSKYLDPREQINFDAAYAKVQEQVACSKPFLEKLWKQYEDGEFEKIVSPKKRGRKKMAAGTVYEGEQFSQTDVRDLEEWILQLNSEHGGVTLSKLRKRFLHEKGLKVRNHTIRKTLLRLGYVWGSAKKMGKLKKFGARKERIRTYLLEYSEALRLQEEGDDDGNEYVIVYIDESYVHQRHTTGFTWGKKTEPRIIRTGGGKGLRIIILHAITKDGLLFQKGFERVENDNEKLNEKRPTAEWCFIGPVKKGDYHRNMNEENFFKYINMRLIPTFEKVYPGKKMILTLDNAPYHHIRADNYIDPLKLKRKGLFDELILTAKMENLTVERNGKDQTFKLTDLRNTARGSKKAPYNPELLTALKDFLSSHPEYQQDKLQNLFDSKGYRLIYTPPYTPTTQPIELLWGEVKRRVADRFKYGRKIKETREQLLDAFYGILKMQDGDHSQETKEEKKLRLGVTPELVQSFIRHANDCCEEFVKDDELLTGNLSNLKQKPISQAQMAQQDQDASGQPVELDDDTNTFFAEVEPFDEEETSDIENFEDESESDLIDDDRDSSDSDYTVDWE